MSYNSPFTGQVIQPTDVSYRAITLSANTILSWPINGNATDNYAARIMDVTATAGSLKLAMPPANQASVGQDALIRNVGSNTFTVTDYDGNTIISLAAGKVEYIYITTNATTAGTWGIIAFGVGTSSADATTLAGSGLFAMGSTLNQNHPVNSVSNGYTFNSSDLAKTQVWAGGAGTINLPAAASLGSSWFILFKNNGTGSIAVTCSGVETLDGTTTKSFAPNESAFIVCTGTSYITVGYGVSNQFNFTALVKPVTSGAYTLSANEAANTIQEYVGVLTGNVTVTYPPVVNLYVVSNQVTAGGYNLSITTGSGNTVTIASGQQATLICDGTNFFNANTVQAGATSITLTNGSVGSPSLSFASEPSSGMYRIGVGQYGFSVLGSLLMALSTGGISVTGTGTFSAGVGGGAF